MKFFVYGSGATFFCLVMEPTQFNRSRSHIRDLELPEPEPSKQVAAPQHWYFQLKLLTEIRQRFVSCKSTYSVCFFLPPVAALVNKN